MPTTALKDAAMSLRTARRLLIQHVNESKVTSENAGEVVEILIVCDRLEYLRAQIDVKASMYGEKNARV